MIKQAKLVEENTLFASDRYEAIFVDKSSSKILISFAERKEPAPASFFAKRLIDKEKCSAIYIRSLINDWYLGFDINDCIDIVSNIVSHGKFKDVIIYGFSMGSYGAVRFAKKLGATRILIGGPIWNVHPSIDRRWLGDYAHLIEGKDASDLAPDVDGCSAEAYVLFDPKGPDAHHAQAISNALPAKFIFAPGAGHMVMSYLQSAGVLSSVVRQLLGSKVNTDQINFEIRKSRKNNSQYVLDLIQKLHRRPLLNGLALSYAARMNPDDVNVLLALSESKSTKGDIDEACKIINHVATLHPDVKLSTPMGKAITKFAEFGGDPKTIDIVIAEFESERDRSREVQLWWSRFLRWSKRYDDAFRAHVRFMNGGAFDAHGHFERGLIFERLGLSYMAESSWRAALAAEPKYERASVKLRRAASANSKSPF